jgi:hypothetical protein
MGGLCSKEGVAEAQPHAPAPAPGPLQKAPSQSLKELITLAAKDEDAPAVHAAMSRTVSNAKAMAKAGSNAGGGAAIAPAPAAGKKEAVEKTAPAVVVITSLSKSYSTAGAPTHHRRDTADANGGAADHDGAYQVISSVPQGFSGEHVIAGWPSWLTSVAGEVVHGWLPRRADTFERLDKVIIHLFLQAQIDSSSLDSNWQS